MIGQRSRIARSMIRVSDVWPGSAAKFSSWSFLLRFCSRCLFFFRCRRFIAFGRRIATIILPPPAASSLYIGKPNTSLPATAVSLSPPVTLSPDAFSHRKVTFFWRLVFAVRKRHVDLHRIFCWRDC